jgi:hypothetical protein
MNTKERTYLRPKLCHRRPTYCFSSVWVVFGPIVVVVGLDAVVVVVMVAVDMDVDVVVDVCTGTHITCHLLQQ